MLTRRAAAALLTGLAAAPSAARSADSRLGAVFYNAVGPRLTYWHADIGNTTLTRRDSVTLPALVQYAWRHPSKYILYAASSNFVPIGGPDGKHHLTAFRIDPATGALSPFGASVAIRSRPIHMTVDAGGNWLLTAYNNPSAMSVHPLGPDGAIGEEVRQAASIDCGVYAHQIRVMPSGQALVLVTRGNNATAAKPEDPGALKLKALKDGQLTDTASVAPGSGLGFGPRHVDFHPTRPWMYVSVERQNQLQMFRLRGGDDLEPAPAYTATTLNQPGNLRPEQMVGPIHLHPNGQSVYLGNRASGLIETQGRKVAAGGENTIAVFSVQETGEPRLMQAIDTHGFHPRTFSIDPTGRMLVVANLLEMPVRDGDGERVQPATLSAYRIGDDGSLTFVRAYDVETEGLTQWWSGFVPM